MIYKVKLQILSHILNLKRLPCKFSIEIAQNFGNLQKSIGKKPPLVFL